MYAIVYSLAFTFYMAFTVKHCHKTTSCGLDLLLIAKDDIKQVVGV